MDKAEYENSELYKLRHTASHLLAMAAIEYDPEVKLAIGPPIENGFYYDFEFSKPFSDEDLVILEKSMQKLVERNIPVEHLTVKREEAITNAKKARQVYKQELMDNLPDEELSFYRIDNFDDLCKGPHAKSTGEVGAIKLLNVAGAYWRGDEKNQMLTRIYGTAFGSKKELEEHLEMLEEAKKRDHRKLGKDLGLFTILPAIGSGLPVWLPKGATLYRLLEEYVRNIEIEAGFDHVITSELGRKELYETSGHLDHYADSMYPPIKLDNETFYLRPMNCPHHISIYADGLHSYKQLPIRIAEFGEVFRYEKSGELSGLQRVRAFTTNDAHIFCREDQIKDEFKGVIQMIIQVYKKLGLKDYWFRLSLHDPKNKKKYSANLEMWEKAESAIRQALKEMKIDYIEAVDEAAFYGPKIDVQMKNVLGREETVSTDQLDFYLPERFGLGYIDENGKKARPVMIHRAILGSMERFIGHYIEQTAGEFPFWLAPVQVKVLPVSEKVAEYSREVSNNLKLAGFRIELDESDETLGKRIRGTELEKIPYIIVVGEKEATAKTVTVRVRHTAEQSTLKLEDFVKTLPKS